MMATSRGISGEGKRFGSSASGVGTGGLGWAGGAASRRTGRRLGREEGFGWPLGVFVLDRRLRSGWEERGSRRPGATVVAAAAS